MINGKMPYRKTLHFRKPTTGWDYFFDQRVDPNFVVQYTHIAFINDTTNMDEVRIGCGQGRLYHWWEQQLDPLADVLYWTNEEYWLTAGEQLVVGMDGGSVNGDVWIYLEGFLYEDPPRKA